MSEKGGGVYPTAPASDPGISYRDLLVQTILGNQELLKIITINLGSFTDNLVSPSEKFDTGDGWTLDKATVTANAVTGPNGNMTASKLVEDATANSKHWDLSPVFTVTPYVQIPVSIYVKAAERSWVYFGFKDGAGASADAFFDLSTGAVGAVAESGITLLSAVCETLDDEWCRLKVIVMNDSSTTGHVYIGLALEDDDITYDGDGTSGAYVIGAQAENNAPMVNDYKPTPLDEFSKPFQETPVRDIADYVYDFVQPFVDEKIERDAE